MAEVVPAEQLRFLFLRPRPNHAIDFDPDGTDQIPRLFDGFDTFAAATAGRPVKGDLPPGYDATFRYSLLDPEADVAAEAAAFRPTFSHLAMLVQIPGVKVVDRVAAEKGSALNPREAAILDERQAAARAWLEAYAPERVVIRVHDTLPDSGQDLDPAQRSFLEAFAASITADLPDSGDAWQNGIFSTAATIGLPTGRAFDAIYRVFLDRTNGPRAGWLLASLDPAFVIERLREAARSPVASGGGA
jgi:lysyl-tRNA synthetase class 1